MEIDQDLTPTTTKPESYNEIKKNIFVSRKKRKWKDVKDKYKCDCHYTANGDDCARNSCYNKLFYYECIAEACAVQDETGNPALCKNRRFQRKQWKKVKVDTAGKKGWGLFADQDIKEGEFVIEYVGEIIDEKECKHRLATTYLNRSKFYILKLEGGKKGESIDATQKGGPARFMNHSCDPNCKAQKWTVGAEVCLGFFADRKIQKGEELTFDYQFQRYGNIKQKCYCGAVNCREYLGAKEPPKSPKLRGMNGGKGGESKKKRRHYRKNKKIVKRTMDERIVIKQCYDYLLKLADMEHDGGGVVDEDTMKEMLDKRRDGMFKCMAKGRMLRREYLRNITRDGLLEEFTRGDIASFDQIIRPYEAENDLNCVDSVLLKEVNHDQGLRNVDALRQFENVITKELKIGCEFEMEHLPKMNYIQQLLTENEKNHKDLNTVRMDQNNCNCSVCLMYGVNSCQYAMYDDHDINNNNQHQQQPDIISSPPTTKTTIRYHHNNNISPTIIPPKSFSHNIPNVNTNNIITHHHGYNPHANITPYPPPPANMDEHTVESYLKLKQESESLVMQSKIKNSKNTLIANQSMDNKSSSMKDKKTKTKRKEKTPKKDTKNKRTKTKNKKSKKREKQTVPMSLIHPTPTSYKELKMKQPQTSTSTISVSSNSSSKLHENEYDDDLQHKEQSDADSQYAANLHKQLNKPHLRSRRTRSSLKKQSSISSNSSSGMISNHELPPNHHQTSMLPQSYSLQINNIQHQQPPPNTLTLPPSQQTPGQLDKYKNGIIPPQPQQHQSIIPSNTSNHRIPSKKHKKGKNKLLRKHKHHNNLKKDIDMGHDADIEDAEETDICPKCGIRKQELKTKGTWSRHLHSKHTYYCKTCTKQFTTANTLSEHEKTVHAGIRSPERRGIKHRKSKYDKYLDSPSQTKLGKRNTTKSGKDGLPDICTKCGRHRGETPKSHWQKHISTDHRYPCPHCKWRFAHRKKYNEHMQKCHTNFNEDHDGQIAMNDVVGKQNNIIDSRSNDTTNEDGEDGDENAEEFIVIEPPKKEKRKRGRPPKTDKKIKKQPVKKRKTATDLKKMEVDVNNIKNTGNNNNDDVEMKTTENGQGTDDKDKKHGLKRKYSHVIADEQPRKKRKIVETTVAKTAETKQEDMENVPIMQAMKQEKDLNDNEDIFKNDPTIKALLEERDKELRLFSFEDFKGYEEEDEIMVSIYDKIDKNDIKYASVFAKEESMNPEIIRIMKDINPKTSIFNDLIFPKTQPNTIKPKQSVKQNTITPIIKPTPNKSIIPNDNTTTSTIKYLKPQTNLSPTKLATKATNSMTQYHVTANSIPSMVTLPPTQINPLQQQILLQQRLQLHSHSAPQPILIQNQQPITRSSVASLTNVAATTNPKIVPKITNTAHFSAGKMEMTAIKPRKPSNNTTNINNNTSNKPNNPSTHRYPIYNNNKSHLNNHHHHQNNSTPPNSSHTPMSHTSNTSISSTTNSRSSTHSNTNHPHHDRRNNNNNRRNTYHHNNNNNYHHHNHHRQDHHHHNNNHHRRYNNNNHYRRYNNNHTNNPHGATAGWQNVDPDNKTLFIDGIPIGCTEEAVKQALKKHGSIKSLILKTKQNKRAQYANVVCFQKHICESLIAVGQRPIPLELPGGQIVHQKLLIQYHNQQKVDEARERRLKEMKNQ